MLWGSPRWNSVRVLLLRNRAGSGFGCPCLLHSQNAPPACRCCELRRHLDTRALLRSCGSPSQRWGACSVGMSWEPEGQRAGHIRTPKLCKPSALWCPPPVLQQYRSRGFTKEYSRRPGRNNKWSRELIGTLGHHCKEAEAWGRCPDITPRPSLSSALPALSSSAATAPCRSLWAQFRKDSAPEQVEKIKQEGNQLHLN